jgi:hypothetical protein
VTLAFEKPLVYQKSVVFADQLQDVGFGNPLRSSTDRRRLSKRLAYLSERERAGSTDEDFSLGSQSRGGIFPQSPQDVGQRQRPSL